MDGDYTLALDKDYAPVIGGNWSFKNPAATYKQTTSDGYSCDGKSITYHEATSTDLVTVSGVKSKTGLTLNNKVVTVAASALGTNNVTISNGYTMTLASDVPSVSTTRDWSFSGTTATYKETSSKGYALATNKKSITYSKAASKTLVTVKGVKSKDGLKVNGNVVTLSKKSLSTNKVTVSNGYTLKLAEDVPITSTKNAWSLSGTTATYKQTTTAGYDVAADEKSVTYTKAASKNLATVKGVKAAKGLALNDKVITVSKAALGTAKVTVGNGYTFKLNSDVAIASTKNAWNLSGTTATYIQTTTTGYELAADEKSITYTKAASKTLATVKGVKDKKGLAINDKIITVSKAALGTNKVTVSNGYTLKLGSDVAVVDVKNAWSLSGSTATYKQTATAGYTLANNAITYSKAANKDLITVKGVKSKDGLKVNDNIVTVSKKALGTGKVTISGTGYKLALNSDVPIVRTTKDWNLSGTTATYKQTATAGYTLVNNSIVYSKAASNNLVTVKGVKSKTGLTLNDKVVTVSKTSLGTGKVTVSNGYTLKLGSDVAVVDSKGSWTFKNKTATYKESATAGYTLADNSITYSKAANKTLVTVKGVKAKKGIALNGKVVTVSKAALGKNKVTISNGYTLKLGSDVTKSSTTTAWNLKGTTATYKQTTVAGYTLADNAINYSKALNTTLVTVKGVKAKKGLTLNGKVVTVSKAALGTNKVTVSKGYTLALGKDVTKSSTSKAWSLSKTTATYNQSTTAGYTLADNAIIYSKKSSGALATVKGVKATKGLSVKNNVVTLKNSALSKNVSVSGSYEFNFAKDYKNASVTGSASADTIKVLGSAITVAGGKGNDILTSSGKKNIFVYASGDGNDVIADFSATDKIKITNGTAKVSKSGSDVLVTVGDGSIKLKDAAGQKISVIDSAGKETVHDTKASAEVAWFLEDDSNFSTDNQLDDLVETKDYSPTAQIDTPTNLTKENNFITYSDKK